MKKLGLLVMPGVALLGAHALAQSPAKPVVNPPVSAREWPTHLHDNGGQRYSPLTQITPTNVNQLKVAWTLHMKPADFAGAPARGGNNNNTQVVAAQGAAGVTRVPTTSGIGGQRAAERFIQSEVTPLVINGVMYIDTPYRKIMALDAMTGKVIWSFDDQGPTRGVEYWPGDATHPAEIIYGNAGGLEALNAKTGIPIAGFGVNGSLKSDKPSTRGGGNAGGSSPPIIYKNVVISCCANPYGDGRDGDIRGFDVRTGKELWRFDTIPLPGQVGYDTWALGSTTGSSGGAHVWGLFTLDDKRGIVYAPTDSPGKWNRYGGDRLGDNLFGSSIIALDATTGKRLWHFQVVHHDIWDMDADSPSPLFDVHKDGKTIPAIGIVSKSALMFIMNRVTGQPIYGVEERPVPKSEVPGEVASPTQPFPVKPAPLGRQSMTEAELNTLDPAVNAFCKGLFTNRGATSAGPYTPPGFNHPTINFPGPNASINWGGGAFYPKLGYFIVNSQDLGQLTQEGPKGQTREAIGVTGVGAPSDDDNIPYDMVGLNGRFKEPNTNQMCQQPPWGRLLAVNVNTGNIAWQVPLGVTDSLPPEKQRTGRPNLGGPIVTASGLVFIGATDDSRFRAFDAKTGKEVWTIKLPAGSHSVPITYMGKNGKQYLVFPSTGGSLIQDPALDDELIAYALP